MKHKEHWMDRAWRLHAHRLKWLLLPAIPGAFAYFIFGVMSSFDSMPKGLWVLGMVATVIVIAGIAHILEHYNRTRDD